MFVIINPNGLLKVTPPQLPPPSAPGNTAMTRSVLHGSYGTESATSYFSHNPLQNASCSGVTVGRSAFVIDMRASGGGLIGKGWVGDVHSPGAFVCGTGRSSMPHIGSPVSRLKTNIRPIFVITATPGITLPSRLVSTSVGGAARSKSQMS